MPGHDAVVVAVHPSGESHLVVDLVTSDLGRLSAVARGARKSRTRFPGGLDVLTRVQIDEAPPRRGELHELREAVVVNAYLGIRKDPLGLGRAAYILELCAALMPRGQPQPESFAILLEALSALAEAPGQPGMLRWAEVRLLMSAGLLSPPDRCSACGEALSGQAYTADHAGHLLCLGCRGPARAAVPAAVVRLLAQCVTWNAVQARDAGVLSTVSQDAGRWLSPVLDAGLGGPLKSRRYLAQLQRAPSPT